jgi:aminoglycoside phosphotransferase (APT) family kinase protein
MDERSERAVRSALYGVVPAPVARRAKLAALEGGVSRRSYLVTAGGKRWVLRLPTPGVTPLLDLATEARVMGIAADAALAPPVVGVDTSSGVLLTEFRAGARAWTAADARLPNNIARAAELLRNLHSLPAHVPVFGAEAIARSYLQELSASVDERLTVFGPSASAWADELLALAAQFDAGDSARVLCHNDLVAANVLDDGATLALVDFEYAVRARPILDLAGLAGMNDYGERESRELLAAYSAGGGPITSDELSNAVRMVRLIAFFWAQLGALRATSSGAYRTLAAELGAKLK